jgi:hypothetical protein
MARSMLNTVSFASEFLSTVGKPCGYYFLFNLVMAAGFELHEASKKDENIGLQHVVHGVTVAAKVTFMLGVLPALMIVDSARRERARQENTGRRAE